MNSIDERAKAGDETGDNQEILVHNPLEEEVDSHVKDMSHHGIDDKTNNSDERPRNPLEGASLFSRIFFLWAYPLVKLGNERPLDDSDLNALSNVDTSDFQRNHLETIWQKERQTRKRPLLARALFRDYWNRTRRARWILLVNMSSRLVQSIALGRVLRILDSTEVMDPLEGYGWGALLVACGLLAFPTKQQQFFETYRIGLQLRTCLVASIYSKILRLPSIGSEKSYITSGHVTNLASNDVEKFLATAVYCNFLLLGPLEALVVLVLGILIVGPSFCAGYGLLCLMVPFQFWLSRRFAFFRGRIAQETDARISWVQQAIHGARIMKQSGFEQLFLDRITKQRKLEVDKLQTATRLKALNESIYFCSSAVVATFIFCIHVAAGGSLTPEVVYTTLTLLSILQFTLTKHIPNAIMGLSECYVSCERIQSLLDLPEKQVLEASNLDGCVDEGARIELNNTLLRLSDVTCHWDSGIGDQTTSTPSKTALSNISLDFERGKLYCVIGKIGSSKSALLQLLSGELQVSSGSIHRSSNSISYAAQEAWIMDATVRENITMGLDFDSEWYDLVVDCCALRHDLAQFAYSDDTIVGDRGIQCSGGQKARIGLARAFYNRQADILLLDDPLSAVDARVAKTIFFSAIQKLAVERGKCVILVTHQHQFVGSADQCILMDAGKVAAIGTFEECKAKNPTAWTSKIEQTTLDDLEVGDSTPSRGSASTGIKEAQEETRSTGIIKWDTWKAYANACGGFGACMAFLAIFSLTQATQLVTFVMLGKWAEVQPIEEQDSFRWFCIVIGLASVLVVLAIFRAQMSFSTLIGCSQELHDSMSLAVIRSRICFFDTNPLGRILNRFSADVGITDELLPLTIYDFAVGAFLFLGSVSTAVAVLPVVLIILPALTFLFVRNRRLFVSTTRELKRLEGIARSPIYATLSETMLGIATLRSNGSISFFSRRFSDSHDKYSRAAWAFMATSRWFAISLDVLSFLLLTTATITTILFHHQRWFQMDPATLGLALTLLIQMANTNFPWMVRQSAEVTNQMVSVERILELCRLESEAPLERESDAQLSKSWPDIGTIEGTNLSARYREGLPLALENIDFVIHGGSRVGVVGRTGSGKSTLVQTFFRLLEAESGTILVDGVDIASVGLHRLRRHISVIPQAPTLFSGCSIRENLDLFGSHSDYEIEKAINDAHLRDVVDSLPRGIHTIVSEGGSNFSVGQRQLLCLARATVSRNKILVIDEATANVDRRTDKLIQETLDRCFQNGTIIAIAHRLETILHSDSIIVMGNGKVLEQGSPEALLADEGTHFHAMAKSGGHVK